MIGYLNDAAAGKISVSVVFDIAVGRVPFFLQVILPLGFLLGIFVSHGRMHIDNEIVSLQSAGISDWKLVRLTFFPALLFSALIAFTSLYLTPIGVLSVKKIFAEQEDKTSTQMLVPGVFQSHKQGKYSYIHGFDDNNDAEGIFYAVSDSEKVQIIRGTKARQEVVKDGEFLVIEDGYRYEFPLDQTFLEELQFKEYSTRLRDDEFYFKDSNLDTIPTLVLMDSLDNSQYLGRLAWRLSLPILPFVIAIIAVQLAKTSPRQGKFAKLIPGVFIYQVYIVVLMELRASVESGGLPVLNMFLLPIVALLLGVSLYFHKHVWDMFFGFIPSLFNYFFRKGG